MTNLKQHGRDLVLALAVVAGVHHLAAQGTAFTYQGSLNDGANPANGSYDLAFSLHSAGSGGSQVGSTITNLAVSVANGLFVATVDFGAVFDGTPYWLQIGVRTNGASRFNALSPRQELTPTPYAIAAENVTGMVPLANLPGAVVTNREASVTFGNLTINGSLNLPATGTIFSGGNNLLAGLSIDDPGKNLGNLNSNALVFGGAFGYTGEGIASKRGGTNAFDLEFYTDFQNRLTLSQNGNVGIGTTTPSEALEINGTSRIDDYDMYLRAGTDRNHGLGYRASVASNPIDGPFLYGFNGGALGTGEPDAIALQWDWQGNTWVSNNLSIGAGLNIDQAGKNIGNVNSNALVFGGAYGNTGEGIASKRSGANAFDLEFYTDFQNRLTISQNGNVGINVSKPTAPLDVNGDFMVVEGLGGVRCYLGDDGLGNDVQVGSLKSGVTAVSCYNVADNAYMHLYCSSITIEGGADLAEPFPISTADLQVPEGAVMAIDEENPGHLKLTDRSYDTRVAGVISGANGINPGIQMRQRGLLEGGKNVALSGRVYVQADTSNGPIRPGDLLTTSSAPGRAMKVRDHVRAQGAILGKAMTALQEGKGMVLVLVTLQ